MVYSATYKKRLTVLAMNTIKYYGISGIANKLMRTYLENRYQKISMKDSKPN